MHRDYEKIHYNTVVAGAMELLNALDKLDAAKNVDCARVMRESLLILNRVLSPIVPHVAHELWQQIGEDGDVIDADWPAVDLDALKSDTIKLVIQVNGKLRSEIEVATASSREEIEKAAMTDPRARKFLEDKPVRKVIIVPGKLVNIVV